MVGPATTEGSFTFTQKSPDCSVRIDSGDSVALPVTNYYKTPGVKSSVILPFEDFSKTASGANFDFVHLKGWVMIQFNPNAVFEFSNFKILKCKPDNTSATSESGSSSTAADKTSGSDALREGIMMMLAGLLSFAFF